MGPLNDTNSKSQLLYRVELQQPKEVIYRLDTFHNFREAPSYITRFSQQTFDEVKSFHEGNNKNGGVTSNE